MSNKKMEPLDMRDVSIIDAFPDERIDTILSIGCGRARLEKYLATMGYRIYATDLVKADTWQEFERLTFHSADIFNLPSFPVRSAEVVICSQVLEHLEKYKVALMNLIFLTEIRLIITVPYKKSFHSPSHVNFWDDSNSENFLDVHEFVELCKPHSVSMSKIRTKPEDVIKNRCNYLIVVDKKQNISVEDKRV